MTNAFDPKPVTLRGERVILAPLGEEHVPGLLRIGADSTIWTYMANDPFETEDDVRAWVQAAIEETRAGNEVAFVVSDAATGSALGSTRYLDIRRPHRGLEIGWTWYGVDYQRSHVNTESKLLLLEHAFDVLGAIRVQLKTDARNQRSRTAIERIGASLEGILRHHMIYPNGYVRDSALFSIVDREWPAVRERLRELAGRGSGSTG